MKEIFYKHYREFRDEAEVEAWAWEHYAGLLSMPRDSKLYQDISAYTGSLFTPVNGLMRAIPPYGTPGFFECDPGDFQMAYDAIPGIVDALNQYETPENIVAYRFTHLKVMRGLCRTRWLRSGLIFSDKAFFSTTLLRKQLVQFGKEHRCNCVLKLYLPKGTYGAYVSFKEEWSLLREYEFLLPPNMKFKIVKVCAFTHPVLIECAALSS